MPHSLNCILFSRAFSPHEPTMHSAFLPLQLRLWRLPRLLSPSCSRTFPSAPKTIGKSSMLQKYDSFYSIYDRWHWRAFLTGGGSAFWLFAYGLFYWGSRMSLDSLSSLLLYLGYLFLLALMDFLVTGTIGFLASYWVVRRLYTAIRVD